jgi:hypothetical protein
VGGCRDTSTLLRYQQPDQATMRKVADFERPAEQSLTSDQAVNNSRTYSQTPANRQSATAAKQPPRFQLPLLGSNQDSPDPESGVLPVTPRGRKTFGCHGAEGSRTPDLCSAIAALSQLSYSPGKGRKLAAGATWVNAIDRLEADGWAAPWPFPARFRYTAMSPRESDAGLVALFCKIRNAPRCESPTGKSRKEISQCRKLSVGH